MSKMICDRAVGATATPARAAAPPAHDAKQSHPLHLSDDLPGYPSFTLDANMSFVVLHPVVALGTAPAAAGRTPCGWWRTRLADHWPG